jgi:hypothetical protein
MRLKSWGLALALLWSQSIWAEMLDVTIHYAGPTKGSVWLGLQQGLNEANIQGEFLGQKYTIQVIELDDVDTLENITALLLAVDAETILNISTDKKFSHIPVFNLNADADELRTACLSNLLNVSASQQMKKDALAQWLAKNPDSKAHVQGWHKGFKKFAASQLNIRFTKAHGVVMDDDAWAGWAAVKLLSDTVARIQSTEADKMLHFLRNEIAFDGQKGAGATFRETGQLRQLVLIVENDKIAAEAPLRGSKGGLDSLGLVSCK